MAVPFRYQGWKYLQGKRRVLACHIKVHKDAHMARLGWRDVDVQQLEFSPRHVLHEVEVLQLGGAKQKVKNMVVEHLVTLS